MSYDPILLLSKIHDVHHHRSVSSESERRHIGVAESRKKAGLLTRAPRGGAGSGGGGGVSVAK